MRRFPYGVYFVLEEDNEVAIVMAVLHLRRNPTAWQEHGD
jgi:hypothetical protein